MSVVLYWLLLDGKPASASDPALWLFGIVMLIGAVIGNMRNVALSTTVTLLVPSGERDKANGMVGAVNGIGFIVTSVISGVSIGMIGMGWTLVIAAVLMLLATLHMWRLDIPEKEIAHDPELANKLIDIRGGWKAIVAVPGLLGLVFFAVFNNLIGGCTRVCDGTNYCFYTACPGVCSHEINDYRQDDYCVWVYVACYNSGNYSQRKVGMYGKKGKAGGDANKEPAAVLWCWRNRNKST